jgi:hypothetical protein
MKVTNQEAEAISTSDNKRDETSEHLMSRKTLVAPNYPRPDFRRSSRKSREHRTEIVRKRRGLRGRSHNRTPGRGSASEGRTGGNPQGQDTGSRR